MALWGGSASGLHHLQGQGLLGGKVSVAQAFDAYIQSLGPVGWWSMRAVSGTNEPNRGSAGAAADMTITSATLGQTGQLGANEAALCDGANTLYSTPNLAGLASLTTWEWIFLVKPTNAGEANFGGFSTWGNGANEPVICFNNGAASLLCRLFNTTPTQFDTTTSTGLSLAAWSLLFVAYDNAGDRKAHLYKGVSAAVSEFAYSAQPAVTGTYKTPTSALNLWNRTNQGITFAGPVDEAMLFNGNLTPTQRLTITQKAGV